MNKAVQICCFTVIATICVATAAYAQTPMPLTGPISGPVDDGDHICSYFSTVEGDANTPVICNELGNESYFGSTWNASVTSFSNTPLNGGGKAADSFLSPLVPSPNAKGTILLCTGNCPGQESIATSGQESITMSVPEGGTTAAYLLLAGICCAGAILRSRRRFSTSAIK